MEICPICGLPKDLCICGTLESEETSIKIRVEHRRYNKPATVIEGINPKIHDLHKLAKDLKKNLACGGTVKGDKIILLGDHRDTIPDILIKMGFDSNKIEVL